MSVVGLELVLYKLKIVPINSQKIFHRRTIITAQQTPTMVAHSSTPIISSFSFLAIIASLLTVAVLPATVSAVPLSTSSRWIVDESGQRVKLACVNWVSHLEPVVAEGLSKQPVDAISKRIASLGFNCVRLTWPTFLATNDTLASVTVRQSFQSLGLSESIAGLQSNNPSIIDLTLIQAYQVRSCP